MMIAPFFVLQAIKAVGQTQPGTTVNQASTLSTSVGTTMVRSPALAQQGVLSISVFKYVSCGSCLFFFFFKRQDAHSYSFFILSRPTSAGFDPNKPWPAWIHSCAWFYTRADRSESSRTHVIPFCSHLSFWTVPCSSPPDQQTATGSSQTHYGTAHAANTGRSGKEHFFPTSSFFL